MQSWWVGKDVCAFLYIETFLSTDTLYTNINMFVYKCDFFLPIFNLDLNKFIITEWWIVRNEDIFAV